MMRCVVCMKDFNDQVAASAVQCKDGTKSHMLQEVLSGSINPDDRQRADFISVDSSDLAKWGKQAKELFGGDE